MTFYHGHPRFRPQGILTSKIILGLKDGSLSGDSSMNDCLRKLREEQVSQFHSKKLD